MKTSIDPTLGRFEPARIFALPRVARRDIRVPTEATPRVSTPAGMLHSEASVLHSYSNKEYES